MTTDEKIEKLARAVQKLAAIMAGQPHEAPAAAAVTDHIVRQGISREMAEIVEDR